MKYLVLDLETVLDVSLPPPKKKADGRDAFPTAPYHQIVVMGAGLLDARYQLRRLWVVGEGKDERSTLAALVGYLEAQRNVTIVTYNGRGFDLPVIAARCLRHGVAFPWYYRRRDTRYRYSADGHLDIMDFLVDHGATRSYSLDVAARLIGMPGKMDCKGSDVQSMIDTGQIDQVRTYCMEDVAQTVALFLRTQLLRGEVDPTACAQAMRVLLETIAGEPRLAAMLPLIDCERLVPQSHAAPLGGAE
jgi:predicted PolB exonuclease-like 3'-5' exonuclease